VRAHARLGLPVVRGAGQGAAGGAVPEGWHLDAEPVITPDDPDDVQKMWVAQRADTEQMHAQAQADDLPGLADELGELSADLDDEITGSGVRGSVLPGRTARRHRSTRRRQDAPDLPRRKITPVTIGKTYTAPDGATYRPSMFLTLTCDSYGKVGADESSQPGPLRLPAGSP